MSTLSLEYSVISSKMKILTNKPIALMLLFVLLLFFVTCSPSREEIAEKVKRSMQQKFDDSYQKGALIVKSVKVLKKNENQYQGIAEVVYKVSTYDVAVE